MLAAIRLSRSLPPTHFLASTRIGLSNLSALGITASSSRILHQDPIRNPIPAAAIVPSSSLFLTHHPFEFQIRFASRNYFSHRNEKAPNVNDNQDKDPKDEDTCSRIFFTRKVYQLLNAQLFVTVAFCSGLLCSGQLRGLVADSPSFACTSVMAVFASIGAQFAYEGQFPLNFVALGLLNLSTSLFAGWMCAAAPGGTVLASFALTTALASSLTASAFRAAKKGYDFKYLAEILIASSPVYLAAVVVRPPPGSTFYIIGFSAGGILWSANIVRLNSLLFKGHYQNDDYVSNSCELYLTLMSLFVHIMVLLR